MRSLAGSALLLALLAGAATGPLTVPLGAQPAAGEEAGPEITLDQVVEAAREHDPRSRELRLRDQIAERRIETLDARDLPEVSVRGQAAYHTAVAELGEVFPGGRAPSPPKDQYSVSLDLEQRLWDGGRTEQEKEIERAAVAVDQLGVATSFEELRRRIEETYFAALLAEVEIELTETLEVDLTAQLERAEARVRAGTALPGQAAVLEAELAARLQDRLRAAAERRGALEALEVLSGLALPAGVRLAVPPASGLPEGLVPLARAVASGEVAADDNGEGDGNGVGTARVDRPELRELSARRRLLAERRELVGLADRPVASAFAQGGVGRPPDQDFFERDLTPFAVVGLRLRWEPLDWGDARRERETLDLEARITEAREAAFLDSLSAQLLRLAHRIEALDAVLAADRQIVELREAVSRQVRAQLREGVITATDFLTERSAEHRARLTLERHRLEQARLRVEFAAALGGTP